MGVVERLGSRFGLQPVATPVELPGLVAGTSAYLTLGSAEGRVVGLMGQLEGEGFPYPLYVAEMSTADFDDHRVPQVVLPSRYPGVEVDMTLTQRLDVPWTEIEQSIREAGVGDLSEFGLKDRYTGEGVPTGAVNTTIYFIYNAADSSLTREAVNERHEALRELLEQRFGWKGDS